MTRRGLAALAVVAGLWVGAAPVGAEEGFPEFSAPVVDDADVIPDDVQQRIDRSLNDYQQRTTNQIAVAVVESIGDRSIEDYTNDLFEEWGVGLEDEDNGVLVVVAVEQRRLRIEPGSGLEGDITDVEANRVIRDHMTPRLRDGDYGGAVEVGTEEIRRLLGDDQVGAPPPTTAPASDPSSGGSIWPLVLGGFFLLSLLGGGGARGRRRRRWGIGTPIIWGGGWGGGGGFGGGGFGGGGGGFGGGGGGGSSGGGASGGW